MLESKKTKESGLSWKRLWRCVSSLLLKRSIWVAEGRFEIGEGDLYILLRISFLLCREISIERHSNSFSKKGERFFRIILYEESCGFP